MGRNVYLSDLEMCALRNAAEEWCEIMASGNLEASQCVDERLKNGLGAALKKLYKGLNGEAYENY